MAINNDKKRFLCYELGLLSLKAALSTRDGDAPVYAEGIKFHQRTKEKKVFRRTLEELEKMYLSGNVTEDQHVEFIQRTADDLSEELGNKLHNGRFRIGVAQKLINVHLKYLWVTGYIEEPPHCPIDGIIRDKAKISYDWTTNDSIESYKQAVEDLKKLAKAQTLSVWELEEFRRRDEE
ncbi:hypothetical protein [Pseudomonas protegens]|uniref:hypothetical protein n=1 Tax=Pseudomonas protegens TaxID=380021 RepID=UPI0024C36DB5|nr:hypothetical protein [Pseudomonas protegens]MDK1396564.1 hypothetical protein [Pseudomonas protegens]